MIEQGSTEWHAMRLGKVTASRINDVLARLKTGKEAASRANYKHQLMVERLTGQQTPSFTNAAMQWGTETEPLARVHYEAGTGNLVREVAFIDHPFIQMSGASPDGLVGTDGLVELKCPNTATHVEWMLAADIPAEHQNQMLWQMACTGRKWCDFVSFDPRMPEYAQIFCMRLFRDDERIEAMQKEVTAFLDEVNQLCKQIESMKGKK